MTGLLYVPEHEICQRSLESLINISVFLILFFILKNALIIVICFQADHKEHGLFKHKISLSSSCFVEPKSACAGFHGPSDPGFSRLAQH